MEKELNVDSTLKADAEALMKQDLLPIEFAIEAIRLNLVYYAFKHEPLLLMAMKKLESLKPNNTSNTNNTNKVVIE